MLILSRSVGETIHIGDDVVVRISGNDGKNVKVSIDAPYEIEVHRGEVYRRIQAERQKEGVAADSDEKPTTVVKTKKRKRLLKIGNL